MIKQLHANSKHPLPWLLGRDTEWGSFYRVRLPDTSFHYEKAKWCRKHIERDAWGKNEGEVFYFARVEDAVAFRLMWEGYRETTSSA